MRSHYPRLAAPPFAVVLALFVSASALAQAPSITPGGVLCGADYSVITAPGMMMSVYGQNLATSTTAASSIPLPTQLAGAQVQITEPGKSAVLAPLYFVSSGQINFQMPFGLTAPNVEVRVRTAVGTSSGETVPVVTRAPRLFTLTADGKGEPILLHSADYSLVSHAAPAIPGEYVLLLLTGLGDVNPPLAAGRAGGDNAGLGPVNYVTAPVSVILGGTRTISTAFAGLMPSLAGLYQLNFQIPADFPSGLTTLAVKVGDATSQSLVSAWVGWNLPQIGAATITTSGGTVSGSGISVSVPSGAFNFPGDVRLYGVLTTPDPAGRRRSPIYKISGLPLTTNAPITVTLDLTAPIASSETAGVVVQTEAPLRGDGILRLPATISGNRVIFRLPAISSDADAAIARNSAAIPQFLPHFSGGVEAIHPFDSREQRESAITADVSANVTPTSVTSADGHFFITWDSAALTSAKVATLAPVLETAYQKLAALGLDWTIRTSWPISVDLRTLPVTDGENWGEQNTSFWGINYSSLALNAGLFASQGITNNFRATIGHELFHLLQEFYDPRNRWYKSTALSPWHWYMEALSTWFESVMLDDDAFVPSTVATDDWAFASRHGLEYPPGGRFDVSHHGYGASMFLRFLAKEGVATLPASVLRRMAARTQASPPMPQISPVSAIKLDVPDLTGAWQRFGRALAAGTIYSAPGGFPKPELITGMGSTYRFVSASDTGITYTWNAPDLSMRGFLITFQQAWNAGTNLTVSLNDPGGTAEAVVYRWGASTWQFFGTFKGSLAIPNAEQFFQNKQSLFILVSEGRAVTPYTGVSPLTLTYKLDVATAFPAFRIVQATTVPGYACNRVGYTGSGYTTGNVPCLDFSMSNWFNWSYLSGTVPLTWSGTSFSAIGRVSQGTSYCDVNITGQGAADGKSLVTATFGKSCKTALADGSTEYELKYTVTDVPFTGKNQFDDYWQFAIVGTTARSHFTLNTYRSQYKNADGSLRYDEKASGPNDSAARIELNLQGR